MPELRLDDDPADFKVQTRQGVVEINALELGSALSDAGAKENDCSPEQMRTAVRAVARGEAVKQLSDHELFAVGWRVSQEFARLGKERGPSPTSRPATASSASPKG